MTLPDYAEDFRGHPACPCQVAWLPVFEGEAQRLGILTGPLPLSQIIGTASTSGNTHSDGGADDTYPLTGIDVDAYVKLSRDMGADATWLRPYNWNGAGGVAHVHRVLRGCPHNGPARYQITAVDLGFNGLGTGGMSGPDTGPRPLSGRTWREGIKWALQQQEEADMAEYGPKILEQLGKFQDRFNEFSRNDRERFQTLRDLVKTGNADLAADIQALAAETSDDARARQAARILDRLKNTNTKLDALAEETP